MINMRNATRLGFIALFFSAACHWGTRPEDFAPAISPAGARVAVRVRGDTADRVGELFAVDSVGVTVYSGRLQRVSWTRLEAMDVKNVGGDYDVSRGESVDAAKRARIAPLSRFPQGLPPDLLRAVLAKLQLSELEDIR